jgi:hypothetical protein
VYATETGWLPFSFPALVGRYLVNQRLCSRNIKRKEGTTRCCVNVVLGLLIQAMEEVLNDQPLFYAVMRAFLNVLLEMFLDFRDARIRQLLNSGELVPEGVGLAHWKVFC